MEWLRKSPEKEGWYFWKRAVNVKDELLYYSYYVLKEKNLPIALQSKGLNEFSLWESGTQIRWPKGGWWSERININGEIKS